MERNSDSRPRRLALVAIAGIILLGATPFPGTVAATAEHDAAREEIFHYSSPPDPFLGVSGITFPFHLEADFSHLLVEISCFKEVAGAEVTHGAGSYVEVLCADGEIVRQMLWAGSMPAGAYQFTHIIYDIGDAGSFSFTLTGIPVEGETSA